MAAGYRASRTVATRAMRPCLLVLLLLASVLVLGCAGDEPDQPNRKWVLVGTDSLTGFYVGKTEGGLLTIRVEDYEYLARRPPTTPPIVPPTEVYGLSGAGTLGGETGS